MAAFAVFVYNLVIHCLLLVFVSIISGTLPASSSLFPLLTSKFGTYETPPSVSAHSRKLTRPLRPAFNVMFLSSSLVVIYCAFLCLSGRQARLAQETPALLFGAYPSHLEKVRSVRLLSTPLALSCMPLPATLCACGTSASELQQLWLEF